MVLSMNDSSLNFSKLSWHFWGGNFSWERGENVKRDFWGCPAKFVQMTGVLSRWELSGMAVWIPTQDYKSLQVAAVIWAKLVNTQTHRESRTHRHTETVRHTDTQRVRHTDSFSTVIYSTSSASQVKKTAVQHEPEVNIINPTLRTIRHINYFIGWMKKVKKNWK